jgi:phosphoribosylformylglycinamidine synthase subunit PurQ / glutaminase
VNTAVIVFPASNCDRDMADALTRVMGKPPVMVWHQETTLPQDCKLVCIPGGFSYGDYLRCGAMAAHSPVMKAVRQHAASGGYILGVCNGFQVLCEAGLLPGALRRNAGLTFRCEDTELEAVQTGTPFTQGYQHKPTVRLPIAHHDGNYYADASTLQRLQTGGQIAFRYRHNPNGSAAAIAGVFNEQRTILGMMPHPERAVDPDSLHGTEGTPLFSGLQQFLAAA